tara:strand:- start:352 stop:549 length:198 start_codon:yes stop_codon:yes gene_type:complete
MHRSRKAEWQQAERHRCIEAERQRYHKNLVTIDELASPESGVDVHFLIEADEEDLRILQWEGIVS